MKRRRKLLILAGIFVAAVIAVVVWPGEREPEYQGRKLSEWLPGYPGPTFEPVFTWSSSEAREALEAIGTNALPCLVKWLDYDRPDWQYRLMRVCQERSPRLWQRYYGYGYGTVDRRVNRMNSAVWAFNVFGSRASPAIPGLVRLMKEGRTNSAGVAAYVLGGIGDDAVPAMLDVFTNRQAYRISAGKLGTMVRHPLTNGPVLVAVLAPYLTNQDAQLRGSSATMLGELRTEPRTVVPGLVGLVGDHDRNVRYRAIVALGRFGADARPGVSCLLPVLGDSFAPMRKAAEHALREIAPEVLTNGVSHTNGF